MNDHVLEGEHSEVARKALRSLMRSQRDRVLQVVLRQERQSRPRPGGAARKSDAGGNITRHQGYVSVTKAAMKDGGRIAICVSVGTRATFVGRTLRLFRTGLPETALTESIGRRIGELVDLEGAGVLAGLSDAVVLEAERHQTHDLFTLDVDMVEVRASDVAAETGYSDLSVENPTLRNPGTAHRG